MYGEGFYHLTTCLQAPKPGYGADLIWLHINPVLLTFMLPNGS